MKIGYCTTTDPYDKKSWSGIHFYALQALSKSFEGVSVFCSLPNPYRWVGQVLNKLSILITRRKTDYCRLPFIARAYASALDRRVLRSNIDALFFPAASELLAYTKSSKPLIYLSDATYNLMVGYYPVFNDLNRLSLTVGNALERKAIDRADLIVYPSRWAADSAITDYKCPINKIEIIPLGANIDNIPSAAEIDFDKKSKSKLLKLLFVGVDWERKGGVIAYETMRLLNDMGVETELWVCGCTPPKRYSHSHLRLLGFLNKNDIKQADSLKRIFLEASMFILPTRSECAGIVFCEAAAFGLPIISTRTGGVSTYVEHEKNGYLLPLNASVASYADTIKQLWDSESRYSYFSIYSRKKYENELNWTTWGEKVKNCVVARFG